MSSVIGIAVEAILFATLGVAALGLIQNASYMTANATGVLNVPWDATVKLLAQTVSSIIVVIAVVLGFLKTAGYEVKI